MMVGLRKNFGHIYLHYLTMIFYKILKTIEYLNQDNIVQVYKFVRLSPPKYQSESTLTEDLTMYPQLWARVVVPKVTWFWCCLWVCGVGQRLSGKSGLPRSIFQNITESLIWALKGIFLHKKGIFLNLPKSHIWVLKIFFCNKKNH